MATQIQYRRGTTAQHAVFTGQLAELTVDTDKKTVVVQDGTTAGGHPLATEASVTAHLNDTTAAHAASAVSVLDTANHFTATDVEGVLAELATTVGGALTNFVEARNTTAPNATIPVHSISATGAEVDIDVVFAAKGDGAIASQVSDGTATGGNKRGIRAVDFQKVRLSADQVASGANSVVAGGYGNTASGANSSSLGGYGNVSSGSYAISGGFANTVSNQYSIGLGGYSNTVSGANSVAFGGESNIVGGSFSAIVGGKLGTSRGRDYCVTLGGGLAGTAGAGQTSKMILVVTTSAATPTPMTAGGAAPSANNSVVLGTQSAYLFDADIVVREAATGDAKAFNVKGLIKQGATAATTALVGTPSVTTVAGDTGAAAWTVAVSADTTLGALTITVTGEAAKTLRWVATVETTEVAG